MALHMTFIDNEINKFSECTNMFCFGNSLKKSIEICSIRNHIRLFFIVSLLLYTARSQDYSHVLLYTFSPFRTLFFILPQLFPIEHFFLKHHLHLLRHLYPRRNHCLRLGSFDMFRPHILDGISETGGNQIQDVDIVKPVINGLSAKA